MGRWRVVAIAGSVLAVLLIAGCSSSTPAETATSAPPVAVSTAPADQPATDDQPDGDTATDSESMDVDRPALAAAIAEAAGVPAETITLYCPETYPNEVGYTFECGLNDGNKDFTVTITVTDLNGNVDFEITAEGLPN